MAAAGNLQNRGLISLGKRFIAQIRTSESVIVPSLSLRSVHSSVYDKNPDDHVHSTVVSSHVNPTQPEQFWSPHPQTGVFGPSADHNPAAGGDRGFHASASEETVLEQKAFFRPLEDLDKPEQA